MGYTFVSYSRKQLYFAESIALHLQKAGIEVWFDLQKLHAGVDWSDALKQGYGSCDRVVLVVSQAALASRYVKDEWQAALDNNREVILAVVEDVEIPDVLKGKPAFDFRGDFDSKIQQLINYINGSGTAAQDVIYPPRRYPTKLPDDMRAILRAMTIPYFLLILTTWLAIGQLNRISPRMGTYVALGSTVWAALFLWVAHRLLREHSNTQEGVQGGIKTGLITQSVVSIFGIIMFFKTLSSGFGLLSIIYLLPLAFIVVVFRARSKANSPDLLRFLPVGAVTQEFRREVHGKLLGELPAEVVEPSGKPVNYSLTFDPADFPLAEFIYNHISGVGNTLASVEEAEKHLFIITNRTSRRMVEEFSEQHPTNAIYLLGSGIDDVDSLKKAIRTQLVDIRENDPNDLIALGKSIGDLETWGRYAALESTPKSFQSNEVPYGVLGYIALGLFQVAGLLSIVFSGDIVTKLIFLTLAFGIYIIVSLTSSRRLSFMRAVGLYLIIPVISILLNFGLESLEPAINTIANLVVMYNGRYWFPAQTPVAKDAIGFHPPRKIRLIELGTVIVLAIIFHFVL